MHSLTPHLETVDVLGVPIFCGNIDDATGYLIRTSLSDDEKLNRCVSATGAHGIVIANKNPAFMQILKGFHMNLCDGRPSMWIGRLKGHRQIKQCPGADFFASLMLNSANTEMRHYFCGGKPGIAEKLQSNCKNKFNNNQIVGTYSPPFRSMTDLEFQQLANDINEAHADIVWIGISTPKQEEFAQKLSLYSKVHFIITVGAAFDFHSNHLKRAPNIVTFLGVEWFYRFLKEPTRLYKRVLETIPAYLWLTICDLTNHFMGRKRISHE